MFEKCYTYTNTNLFHHNIYRDIIKDVSSIVTGAAYIKRFKNCVRKLQYKYSNYKSSDASQINLNQIYVVMSNKESEAMKLLQDKLIEIDIALQKNNEMTTQSLTNRTNIEENIKSAISKVIKKIKEKEKLLFAMLNEKSNEQLNALKHQRNILEEYKVSMQTAQAEQNSLVLDPTIDAKKRETKIETITNDALAAVNDDIKIKSRHHVFEMDEDVVNEVNNTIIYTYPFLS